MRRPLAGNPAAERSRQPAGQGRSRPGAGGGRWGGEQHASAADPVGARGVDAPGELVPTAVQVTGRMPQLHGAPVQVGAPSSLGIADLARPDFGDREL